MPYIRSEDGSSHVVYVDKLPDGYVEEAITSRNFGRRGKPLRPQYVNIRRYAQRVQAAIARHDKSQCEWAPFGAMHETPAMLQIIAENCARDKLMEQRQNKKVSMQMVIDEKAALHREMAYARVSKDRTMIIYSKQRKEDESQAMVVYSKRRQEVESRVRTPDPTTL
ncbi:hypothetical protein EDC01DRAFT_635189 [Geopyxis carbonaria]|nr:hypothetical protein EDC01DRAFT_635189 [Geopyxis carbonaria]